MQKRKMFYGAGNLIFSNAKALRRSMTPEENVFWLRLKETFIGYKFRRQHPISNYIVDFYCHKLKLVIEIDGPIHESTEAKTQDEKRQGDLENLGLTVLRFKNDQVNHNVESVINTISSYIIKF